MSEHALRPGGVAIAAVLIGGVLVIAFPHHVLSIIRVVVATAAAVAALHALAVNVPLTGWISPYKWMSPFSPVARREIPQGDTDEVDFIHSKLSGWRQPIKYGPPMPPAVLRLLRPIVRSALGLGQHDEVDREVVRNLLSPVTWAILVSDPLEHTHWFLMRPPDARKVTEVVHHVLDDIERIAPHGEGLESSTPATPG